MLKPNLSFLQFIKDYENFTPSNYNYQSIVNSFLLKNRAFNSIPQTTPEILEQIKQSHSKVDFIVETIVVIGIGGSSLGAKTIIEMLGSKDVIGSKVFFIDSVDPETVSSVLSGLDFERTLFFVVSNSGSTIETLSVTYHALSMAESRACDIRTHFQFIIGSGRSELFKLATKYLCPIFYWPQSLCGRFSFFSISSLLPASYAGVDIKDFLQAASKVNLKYNLPNPELNSALKLASIYHYMHSIGFSDIVLFNYSDRLKSFGEWVVQLVSESLGKNQQAPNILVSRGVTDQHSALKLYKEGPNNKFYIFISPKNHNAQIRISHFYNKPVSYLHNETFNRLHNFEMQGTIQSLVSANRPVIDLALPKIDTHNTSSLAMFFMFFTVFLAEIMQIDAFNQPGVEESKIITKALLESNKLYHA